MMVPRILGLGLLAFGLVGCDKPIANQPVPLQPVPLDEPTQAQPRLQTIKLWVGPEVVETELALDWRQQQAGMMFRTNMAEGAAMLFVFPTPHQASFWMKNTPLPLSVAYIDPEGVIQEIHDLQPHNTNSVMATSTRIQYVLETPQGWFRRHNVSTGAVIRTERGSLRESFTFRSTGQ